MFDCECVLRMRQNESLHVAIDLNATILSDGKLTHTEPPQNSTRRMERKTTLVP